MKYYCRYFSSTFSILLFSDDECLLELKLNADPSSDVMENQNLEVFQKTRKWLDDYFQGQKPNIKIPLKMQGTDFQKEVWNILLEIPYGQVVTYGYLANLIARKRNIPKMSSQAIGNALHQNPIPIIVPCHRVIGKNKNLVGYGLGMDLKIKMLKLEGMDLQGYYFYEDKNKKFVE